MTRTRRRILAALLAGLAATFALRLGFDVATPPIEVAASLAVGAILVLGFAELLDRVWEFSVHLDRRVGATAGLAWLALLGLGYVGTDLGTALSLGVLAGFIVGLGAGLTLDGDPRTAFYHGMLVGATVGLCSTLLVVPPSLASTPPLTGVVTLAAVVFPVLFGLFCGGGSALGGWVRYVRRFGLLGHN